MSNNYQARIARMKDAVNSADHILIGAGAGLSSAAGLTYSGQRFTDNFQDFIEHCGLTDMYSSMFYQFKTREERWAYYSRHIKLNRYDTPAGTIYTDLLKMVHDKDYFVITTNADGLFFKAGFDANKVFAPQGDYTKFQCSAGCHDTLYDNKEAVMAMVEQQVDCKIPTKLIPYCPVCGKDMYPNIRIDDSFVEDDNWHSAQNRYSTFMKNVANAKIVLIEFGVGYNTPIIIKYPFEQFTAKNKNATLVRINRDYPEMSDVNKDKTIVFNEDTGTILKDLQKQ